MESLPSRGAWIEMSWEMAAGPLSAGRSPHGERGLKCSLIDPIDTPPLSLPSRGAWIEIGPAGDPGPQRRVAPLTGSVD